jgi:large subunit ribosomal protein L21
MYAIFTTGGKQYRVAEGDVIRIEKLDAEAGASVDFDNVLMIGGGDDDVQVGAPYIEGGKITALIRAQERAKKIEIIKFRRRKHHQKRTGHRQYVTQVEIKKISA